MENFIIINKNEDLRAKSFYIDKKTTLTFKPGPTCVALNISLKTNYPIIKNSKFQRQIYYPLNIVTTSQDSLSSSLNWTSKLQLDIAGVYHFLCESGGAKIWEIYVIVKPDLKVQIGSIRCQTILAKNLGALSEWRNRLGVTIEAGYNMIHLTPVQELGSSNSSYSIRHQHKVNPIFKASLDDIKREVDYMYKKFNIITVTDIVLNHTANDSEWIREHPECSYNLSNSKHLRSAFLLDSAFVWLTKDIISGNLQRTHHLTTKIKSESDFQAIEILLRSYYVPQMKLVETFGQEEPDMKGILDYAINNAMSAMRYERLNPQGCFYGKDVSAEAPLVAPYFTHTPYDSFNIIEEEREMYKDGSLFMAHNGWVMGADSFQDFASSHSKVYLKRELIAWGDSVKLRFGDKPEHVPYLWAHIKKYVESQAKVFHGFRLDNCHSTPLHVAEFVVDTARAIRPDIYIMAELFTSSEAADNIFVNRLGITSLIREAMSAHNCRELGRLIHRFGGTPVGAFTQPDGIEPLKPQTAIAIFYDQTHDNESLITSKSLLDVVPITSLINMANCATGSTRGYDELVPHQVNVVSESRPYATLADLDKSATLIPLRRKLNIDLMDKLKGFSEIFIDQVSEDVMAITRLNPTDGRTIVLIARTSNNLTLTELVIEVQGNIFKGILEATGQGEVKKFAKSDKFINGLEGFSVKLSDADISLAQIENSNDKTKIHLNINKFSPSSVLAVEVHLNEYQTNALNYLNNWQVPDLKNISLTDANFILFRCPEEDGWQPYEIPGLVKFTYSGLYGLMFHLQKISENQDQAHPLCDNLRKGNWLCQYIIHRLQTRRSLAALTKNLQQAFEKVYLLHRGMIPKYFHKIVSKFYVALEKHIYSSMGSFVRDGPKLVQLLALSSIALVGESSNAPLPAVGDIVPPSIAAGLPHFASGFMRNWGRDTFIALRGLLLIPERFEEAKNVILSYGITMNHGLIPNLLDSGINSRYNCRDAIWWWLYTIKEYVRLRPNGHEILKCKVKRIHLSNSTQYLYELIQDSLEHHFKGTSFTEERAGKQLDEHMTIKGFNITFGVDRDTGFVYGGNEWNCGTWMDKMGSSLKAGTKGKPASPRDGSAVEIVGLSYAVINWLDDANKRGHFPYDGVECLYDNTITLKWTWKKWANLIKKNFERCFYIPEERRSDDSALINKRGIYMDSVNASIEWQNYQLRPNFLITMVVAPDLFNKENARRALLIVKNNLCGPVGMKTLDPSDFNYRPDYINSDNSMDPKVANGFNYHQGPEWLWLTGYYIRAANKFCGLEERDHHLQILSNLYEKLVETPWLGLPELTNGDGKFCPDSCTIQAWSLGTIMEALYTA